jgi:hypothetical protein
MCGSVNLFLSTSRIFIEFTEEICDIKSPEWKGERARDSKKIKQ